MSVLIEAALFVVLAWVSFLLWGLLPVRGLLRVAKLGDRP